MNYQDIDHHNGMVVIPALALTKEVPIQALGMYVLITAYEEDIAFNDQRMSEVFAPLYGNQLDWIKDRDLLVEAGLLSKPVELESESEEEAAERSEKARGDWDLVDEELEERMMQDEFRI